jgi:putative endonuclease
MNNRRSQGREWEKIAETFLNGRGLKTLERNYYCRLGEIDLIMMDRRTLVFTEVRFRRESAHGSGAESVTFTKQKRITRAAQRFLQQHQHHHIVSHDAQAALEKLLGLADRPGFQNVE